MRSLKSGKERQMTKVDSVLLHLRGLHTMSEINYILQGVEDAITLIQDREIIIEVLASRLALLKL